MRPFHLRGRGAATRLLRQGLGEPCVFVPGRLVAGRASCAGDPRSILVSKMIVLLPEPLALRHKLLAVPALRKRYLAAVGDIADKWLDWERLGPLVERYQRLMADDVARDTRKLDTTAAFTTGVFGAGDGTPPLATTIKGFADQRRAALLSHPEIAKARARDYQRRD